MSEIIDVSKITIDSCKLMQLTIFSCVKGGPPALEEFFLI